MRTTRNIQDEALALGNRVSRELGDPLGEVVNEALAFDLPVSGRGGLLPGVDLDNSSMLADVMDRG